MALRTNGFPRLYMTGPAGRSVPLSRGCAHTLNVRLNRARPNLQQPVALVAVHPYARRLEVGSMLEIVHGSRGARTLLKLQRCILSCMADLAAAELLTGLMGMTIIALRMAG